VKKEGVDATGGITLQMWLSWVKFEYLSKENKLGDTFGDRWLHVAACSLTLTTNPHLHGEDFLNQLKAGAESTEHESAKPVEKPTPVVKDVRDHVELARASGKEDRVRQEFEMHGGPGRTAAHRAVAERARRRKEEAGTRVMMHEFWLCCIPSTKRNRRTVFFVYVILPLLLFLLSAVFGGLFAMIEGWDWWLGLEFVLSTIINLSTPLHTFPKLTTKASEVCTPASRCPTPHCAQPSR
jgi:hypothetical protein